MTEREKDGLREKLEEKRGEMNTLLDNGDRTKYVVVESEIYELKKQIGKLLSDW